MKDMKRSAYWDEKALGLLRADLPVCMAYVDQDQRYKFVNSTYEQWFGVKSRDIVGARLVNVIGYEAYEVVQEYVERALGGQAVSYEARVPYKGGKIRHIQADLAPDRDPEGQVVGYYAVIKDISDKKAIENELVRLKGALEEKVGRRTAELKSKNVALENEIIRRAETEERLRESEKLLRTILETMNEGVVVFDRNGLISFSNKRYADELGLTPEELVGRSPYEVVPENEPLFIEQYKRRKLGLRDVYELDVFLPDGSKKPVVISSSPLLDENGSFQGSVTVFTDITEIKKAQEIVQRAEARYKMIVELASEGIGSLNASGRLEYVNEQLARMLGYTPEEMIGTHYSDYMDEPHIAEAQQYLQRALQGSKESFDFKFRRKDGGPSWALVSGAPIYSEAGEPVGAFGMVTDITKRKEAEQELHRAKTLLQTVIENMPTAVFLKDAKSFKFKMFNKAAAELAGISDPEEALGKTDYDFTTEEQADYFRKTDIEALKTGGVVEISEEILDNRAGRSIYLRSKKAPIYDQEGKAEYVLGITENITEEKRSRDVIEAALAEKEVLLREIHHRVKNNLAIISSLLNLQSAHSSNRPLNEVFEEIQVRIRSMASAHELLYKSQHLAYIDAADYVNNLVDHMFVSQAKLGTSIELIKEIDNITFGLDTAIPLGLLVTELVSNCLKHAFDPGQEGMAFIGLKRMDENLYELTVRDNGKGLPPDVDINNPESMGLDLVNAFTARLNGEIFIAKPQKGSEIRIVFTGFGK